MRLLLDEHYSKVIAEQLRQRGLDVLSVAELPELAGSPDEHVLASAAGDGRAIVTEDWADFARLLRLWERDGRTHAGVIFTSRRRFPRRRDTVGRFVDALAEFLSEHPADDALRNAYAWLAD